jgi:prepilin-type N-terminal cleavage/methylation domain-containing protein/prepilin-type processing-associated H-X9-DG protein
MHMTIRNLKVKRGRRGFTLVEVMVVMTIIAILISILVPAVGYVRETARGSQCRASLRQYFVGFTGIADKTKEGKLSSGAWDGRRDGCMDTIGWVADLVNSKVCKPQELLCPTNPSKGTEKYNDLIGTSTASANEGGPTNLVAGVGYCATKSIGTWTGREVGNLLLAKGYGTNHMTTWFMSRTAPKVSASGGVLTYSVGTNGKLKGLAGSLGALTRRTLDTSPVSSNTVPLMGDSNLGDIADRPAEATIDDDQGTVYIQQGDTLVESFSDGPSVRTSVSSWQTAGSHTLFDPTNPLLHVSGEEQPPPGTAAKLNNLATNLQDYRDFGPVHSGAGNVLFADGSVKTFNDQNGDSFLNPGFDGTPAQAATRGYSDNLVELPAAEIFSGILLQKFYHPKQTLDP